MYTLINMFGSKSRTLKKTEQSIILFLLE